MNYITIKRLYDKKEKIHNQILCIEALQENITPVLSDMPKGGSGNADIADLVDKKIKLEEQHKQLSLEFAQAVNSIPVHDTVGTAIWLRVTSHFKMKWRTVAYRVYGDPSQEESLKKRVERFWW